MNIDLNYDFIREYKRKYTTKLVEENIGKGESITGKQILKLTSSRQYNFFIIKILFQEWQEEMKQLESPYFDYREPVVRKAMVEFMNVLSQYIKVDDENMLPLLDKAFDETLLLNVDPATFLELELKGKHNAELSQKLIRQLTKYVVILKDELTEFLNEVEGESLNEVIEKAKYYFEGHDSQGYLERYVESLSKLIPVEMSDFLAISDSDEAEEEVATEIIDEIDSEPDVSDVDQDLEEESIESMKDTERVKQDVREEVISNMTAEEDEDAEEGTINKKYDVEAKTLADLHEEKKIDSIMEAISINHRYMFLQELFDGDNDQFQKAVSEVEECDSFDAAVELLVQNYAKEYFWDMNSDEVKELLKVVFRRFRN